MQKSMKRFVLVSRDDNEQFVVSAQSVLDHEFGEMLEVDDCLERCVSVE